MVIIFALPHVQRTPNKSISTYKSGSTLGVVWTVFIAVFEVKMEFGKRVMDCKAGNNQHQLMSAKRPMATTNIATASLRIKHF